MTLISTLALTNMNKSLVSKEECVSIVKKLIKSNRDNVQIIDFDVDKYCEGYPGFLGEYFSLQIQYRIENGSLRSEKFFVKSLPVENIGKRELIEQYGIFKKEANFFKVLAPNLLEHSSKTKWIPVVYLSRDDLIVFEDLKTTSYQTLPRHIDPTINHIKMALCSLAAFHAANIIYEGLELRPEGSTVGDAHKNMLFETSYAPDNPWCMTGIRALKTVALHKTKYGFGSSYERAIEEKFMGKVCGIFDLLESTVDFGVPRVCCHRDLWKNNLMYQFEDGDFNKPSHCLLIDFQICRYLPLTLDVIICVLLSSRRQQHSTTDECLEFYYKQLADELMQHNVNIESIMSWRDFEVSCQRFKLFPLVQQGMFWSLANLPETFFPNLLATNEKEYVRICNEQRDETVLEFMECDEFYRQTMTETVERLIEYLFVNEEEKSVEGKPK